ncbi:MAG: MFS transporter [Flavobacteriaceae bacterium]|nr:MFS transporter [Flavobacteriaceae bacterium]MAU64247.1 MFS transporter [Flavobacteriaceae bacterium]|tara:strand:+ start:1588 stop:2811 length:1224 start_codon:yes stop_codon:yes gene_type:complete
MNNSISKNKLFTAACISLIVTAMTFAIRAGILTDLGIQFDLSDTQLGYINSLAFLGFPVATVIGGLLYNFLGARKLMIIAFLSHVIGLIMTIYAGGFTTLLVSSFFIGFANGSVEAACNPLIADMYTKNRTAMLNKFHVWFPGGIVIGALTSGFMSDFGMGWELQIAVMLIPTAIYGYLFFKEEFPESENVETDTSVNIQSLFNPLFLLIIACMTLTAISEFGPQQWIERILGNSGVNPLLILAMVSGIMALGRYFAGPIVHKLNPIGVLLMSAVLTTIAVYYMSIAEGSMIYFGAVLFAFGVCYFWPTMIGFVSEYMPKTGALGMSLVGGAGMLSTSIWQPVIGSWLDAEKEIALNSGVAEDAAELIAGKAALGNMAYFPLALILLFGILFAFRKKLEENRVSQAV